MPPFHASSFVPSGSYIELPWRATEGHLRNHQKLHHPSHHFLFLMFTLAHRWHVEHLTYSTFIIPAGGRNLACVATATWCLEFITCQESRRLRGVLRRSHLEWPCLVHRRARDLSCSACCHRLSGRLHGFSKAALGLAPSPRNICVSHSIV